MNEYKSIKDIIANEENLLKILLLMRRILKTRLLS